jgi:methyl-accepting chemotaxis protein
MDSGQRFRGFAVVAGEIKQLAEQTNNSTGEIGKVINDLLEKTSTAVKTIGEAQASIESGAKLSRKLGEVPEKIVGMSEMVLQIRNAVGSIFN